MTTIMPLFNQVKDILRKHKFLLNNIEVIHAEQLFKLDSPNVDLFILDEADELTRTLAVKFDQQNELTGLYKLLKRKVLLCSATFSDFESEIVEHALCIPRDEWMKFDAAPEFASGQKMQNDIAYDKSATDEETA